jgi:hypothetical protein
MSAAGAARVKKKKPRNRVVVVGQNKKSYVLYIKDEESGVGGRQIFTLRTFRIRYFCPKSIY